MRNAYLTRDGGAYVFQIRVPRSLDSDSSLAPIRVRLGNVSPRFARRIADILAGSARLAFQRMQLEMGSTSTPTTMGIERLTGSFQATLQVLRGIDAIDETPLSSDIRSEMIDASFDALIAIGHDQDKGIGPFARRDVDFAAPYLAALRSEAVARSMVGKPLPNEFEPSGSKRAPGRPDTGLAHLQASLDSLSAMIQGLGAGVTQGPVFKGELFSSAADAYIANLRGAHGDDSEEAAYYVNRKKIFIALCGDKPVDSYTSDDLQNFVNLIAWLPPNSTKFNEEDIGSARLFIERNRIEDGQGLAQKTIKNSYLSRVKTVLRTGCDRAHVPFVAGNARIIMPRRAPPPKKRPPSDQGAVGKIIQAGIASGMLLEALLPTLGLLTGRRLALLVNMRREDIIQLNDVWVVVPNSHMVVDGQWVRVPFKTNESLAVYVLHPILADCGFIAWAQKENGFLFEHIMKAKDPADAAQKRMGRLFSSVGVDSRLVGTFHSLRHAKIASDRSIKLPARLIRAQVGHELGDVHDNYGSLSLGELRQLRDVPLPEGIDWGPLATIDFEKFSQKRPVGGRPRKT